MSNDIRAALERLIELDDTVPHNRPGWIQEWTNAIAAARAVLAAEPVGERAINWPAYFLRVADKQAREIEEMLRQAPPGRVEPLPAAPVNLELMAALIEIQRLRDLCQTLATPPAPEPGEVGELVRRLEKKARMEELVGGPLAAGLFIEAATLLQQLSAPAPAVVPVPVAERPWEKGGWTDLDGECWWCPPDGPAYWSMANPAMVYGGWLLPAHAIPLTQTGGSFTVTP
jgi:hypothetical protein